MATILNADTVAGGAIITADASGVLVLQGGGNTGITISAAGVPTLNAPALGTPSSGTLTNATGLPPAGVTGTAAILGANTFTGLQNWAAGVDIASATTVDLTAATGNTVVITGTTPTTGFTMVDGQPMLLLPSGAWPITFNSTTANINGGVSYTCAAGDRVYVVRDLADVIRVSVIKQDGTAVVATAGGLTLGTPEAGSGTTSITYTGIPAGTKYIAINFRDLSTSSTGVLSVQLGDAGGIENTGYVSATTYFPPGGLGPQWGSSTTEFVMIQIAHASARRSGTMYLYLQNAATFTWVGSSIITDPGRETTCFGSGYKPLSAELTQVRITTTAGTDTFDGGDVNISYQ